MSRPILLLVFLSFFVSPPRDAAGQSSFADSGFHAAQLKHAIDLYDAYTADNAALYNGREYVDYVYHVEGHPFVMSGSWKESSVFYDGRLYEHVPLIYDIARNELVIKAYGTPLRIVLQNEKVDWFSLADHRFVHARNDSSAGALPAGFYDTIYEGDTEAVVRRTKYIKEEILEMKVSREFISRNYFYIRKDGIYYPVEKLRSALKVLEDRKRDLKKYLKKRGIRFREDPEYTIREMIAEYDRIARL